MAGISISLDLPTLQSITVEAELNNETISACAKRLILAALDSPDLLSKKRTRKKSEENTVEPGCNAGIHVDSNGVIHKPGEKKSYQVVACYNEYKEYTEKKCGKLADAYCPASGGYCPFLYVQPLFDDGSEQP